MADHGGTRRKRKWLTAVVSALLVSVALLAVAPTASASPVDDCSEHHDGKIDLWSGSTYVEVQVTCLVLNCDGSTSADADAALTLAKTFVDCVRPDCQVLDAVAAGTSGAGAAVLVSCPEVCQVWAVGWVDTGGSHYSDAYTDCDELTYWIV